MLMTRQFTFATIVAAALLSLCFAPIASAQFTGLITDSPTITVGQNGGYCTPAATACGTVGYGAVSAATLVDGRTLAAFVDLPGPPKAGETYFRTQLSITGFGSDPGQNSLDRATCGAVTYIGATASSYNYSSGRATWFWNWRHGAQPSFQGRTTVSWPKYQVVGLTYAPPGSRSAANYSSGFMNGTNTSSSSTFTEGISQEVSITSGGGFFGIFEGDATQTFSAGWTQQKENSRSIAISQQNSNGLIVPGPASSAAGVDHDFDTIYVWLNPEVFIMVFPTSVVVGGYGFDLRDPVGGMDVVPLTVGQLRGTQPIAPNIWSRLNRTWDPQTGGLTTAEFQVILRANPFATNPAYNPNTDPSRRYELPLSGNPPLPANVIMNYTPAPPGAQPIGQTYGTSYNRTTTQGQSARETYDVSYSISGSASFEFFVELEAKFKTTGKWSWSNGWSNTLTNGTSQSASFTIYPPSATDNYTGPTAIQVWKDNIYGTFMFYPAY
jgi:hypothetical protein